MTNSTLITLCLYFVFLQGCSSGGGDGGGEAIEEGYIRTHITLAFPPESIIINQAETPDNVVEYAWRVLFDLDENGEISEGDIVFSIEHHNDSSLPQEVAMESLDARIGVQLSANTVSFLSEIDHTIEGNSIIFKAEKSKHDSLNLISYQTQIMVHVSRVYLGEYSFDSIPSTSLGMFTQVQDNSIIVDDARDYYGNSPLVDILEFKLEISQ